MDNKTVQYKRTVKGSVGAGVGALFNGEGRRYYVLVYKDSSRYHAAGESQKVIIDQVEIGRASSCQVQFDETFETVSRRHAAIVRDGDHWKLVQLSTTNSTLLNGHEVTTEWYLENGDEIQLSVGGPRIGFIVPAGKQSLVSSIKMTERLELFRKQALKPYKGAITALSCLILVLALGGGYALWSQHQQIEHQKDFFTQKMHEQAINDSIFQAQQDSIYKAQHAADSARIRSLERQVSVNPDEELKKAILSVQNDVFAVITTVYAELDGEKSVIQRSQGTGFLLSDGRFVTARHCVEPWMYDVSELQLMYALSRESSRMNISAGILAINSKGERINFTNSNFKVDTSMDVDFPIEYKGSGGETGRTTGRLAVSDNEASWGSDWAYAHTSAKGTIADGKDIASTLTMGSKVHLLGFPKGNGIGDGTNIVEPIYNEMSISRNGVDKSRCLMVSQGADHGNSGGPVFYMKNHKLVVIGIVSRGDSRTELYDHIVPMSNLK
jgi:hypothetical protein